MFSGGGGFLLFVFVAAFVLVVVVAAGTVNYSGFIVVVFMERPGLNNAQQRDHWRRLWAPPLLIKQRPYNNWARHQRSHNSGIKTPTKTTSKKHVPAKPPSLISLKQSPKIHRRQHQKNMTNG